MDMSEMKSSFDLPWNSGQQMYTGKGHAPMSGSWIVSVEAQRNGGVIASLHTRLIAQ
jgi:hypothetical protein